MKPKHFYFYAVTCAVLSFVVFAFGQEYPQDEAGRQPRYSQIMNRAFQFSEGIPAELNGTEYRIVLRVMPSSRTPESQIVLLKQKAGPTLVVQYKLKDGSRPIVDEYNDVLRKDRKAGIADVLNRIVVEKTQQTGSDSVGQLVDELLQLSIPTKLSTDLCMDGTTYELWVQTPSNWIHASLSNCAYGEKTEAEPIFRWINELEIQVRQQVGQRGSSTSKPTSEVAGGRPLTR